MLRIVLARPWSGVVSESRPLQAQPLPERVEVGRIGRPHGVTGELSVEPWSDLAERFALGSALQVQGGRVLRVAAVRPHKDRLLVRFEGVDDRDQAETLRGAVLEVERGDVPPLPAGEFYYFELVGCLLEDSSEGTLGCVLEVLEDGGGLLLRVAGGPRGEVLVPFVKRFLEQVDVARRRIAVRLPPGLIESCASTS